MFFFTNFRDFDPLPLNTVFHLCRETDVINVQSIQVFTLSLCCGDATDTVQDTWCACQSGHGFKTNKQIYYYQQLPFNVTFLNTFLSYICIVLNAKLLSMLKCVSFWIFLQVLDFLTGHLFFSPLPRWTVSFLPCQNEEKKRL